MTHTGRFQVATRGNTHVIDITDEVQRAVAGSGIRDGILVVPVVGSTASITTTEAEPGLLNQDLKAFCERLAPAGDYYRHEETWHASSHTVSHPTSQRISQPDWHALWQTCSHWVSQPTVQPTSHCS